MVFAESGHGFVVQKTRRIQSWMCLTFKPHPFGQYNSRPIRIVIDQEYIFGHAYRLQFVTRYTTLIYTIHSALVPNFFISDYIIAFKHTCYS
ncbi:hypothetical protein O5D80_003042 [Batrachochytrium dendrobatidis]|nr:hypothetical protein O5D80_003042 [Batrachochytrium dendrobatidis]